MVPRVPRAQKMDALSSIANILGYRAVIEAGKVRPAKVLVVGAGVAGLAAIGTATSLSSIVYAFDVRPEVAEQIEPMGAQFVFLEFEDAQDRCGRPSRWLCRSAGRGSATPGLRTRYSTRRTPVCSTVMPRPASISWCTRSEVLVLASCARDEKCNYFNG